MQLTKWYNAMFSKQQQNPDPQNAGQVKKGAVQGLMAKIKLSKRVITLRKSGSSGASTSVNNYSEAQLFLENVSFFRNWDIKLLDFWQKSRLQYLFGLSSITQTEQKNLFSSPLGKLKSKKISTSLMDLASGNLDSAAIETAAAYSYATAKLQQHVQPCVHDIVRYNHCHIVTNHMYSAANAAATFDAVANHM